ncbi:MAG: SGNH/GDSL hydrolase family protein, partial [Clostridia bacterium]|nr:SGNH/GDSL hydrolase family protein [Clostridia bacterium]
MSSKNIFILGDSYSTFEGYNPEGYSIFYPPKLPGGIDVMTVEQTWWRILADRFGWNIVRNSSFSGTTI